VASVPFTMNVSFIIIGITALLSFYAFSNADAMRKMIMNPYLVVTRNQYYRFITSGLIHKDHMHLIFNMLALYFFGPVIERVFLQVFGPLSTLYFVLLYVLAMVVADLPSYFKHRHNPGYNSLGASGAVSAVVFAFILFLPLQKICLYFVLCVNGFILGALYLIYSYYQGKKGGGLVNHDAHLYGSIFGVIYCILLYPQAASNFIEQIKTFRIF
jgi:membrane associated rhomboid family serine protease